MRHKIIYSISLIFYFSIAQIDYNNQIQPIFDNNCVSCHSNGAAYTGGIELTSYDELMAGGYTTNETNVLSILDSYVTTGYMPPTWGGAYLDQSDIDLISQWIAEGGNGPMTGGCVSDLDNDGICEDECDELEMIVEDCECSFFDPNTYTVSYTVVDETSCTLIESCYCECINDSNDNGICDEDESVQNCPCINPDWIDPFTMCPMIYDPVIGCDGAEYSNSCVAQAAGLTSWTNQDGTETSLNWDCNENNCIAIPLPGCMSMTVVDPVCGCDGVTYGNSGEAECNSIYEYTAGACEDTLFGCYLSAGTFVENGWSGNGEGSNWCNSCFCENGILSCTEMFCGDNPDEEIFGCTDETACNYMNWQPWMTALVYMMAKMNVKIVVHRRILSDYGDNEFFTQTYNAPPGLIITINFAGSTESCCDHIYVNGIIWWMVGTSRIGDETLVIEWTTDSSVNSNSGYGWSAELICEEPILGCTQIYADNYNPDANTNDGSCILDCDYLITYESYVDLNYDNSISNYYCNYYLTNGTYTLEEAISFGYNCDCIEAGCTDETACNYDSSVTFDNGSCEYGCFMDDCVNYPVDFFDCSGNCLSDYYIDNCSYYQCENGLISTELTVFDGCNENDILGCTDETACNYIPTATFDNGTCVYDGEPGCENCGYQLDFNNYGDNEVFSQTFEAPPGLIMTINFSGSTESCCDHIYVNGVEYDGVLDGIVVGAETLLVEWTSDGSVNSVSGYGWSAELLCEEVYEGCTLPYAENYNADANINDGSCILECGYFLSYDSYLDNSSTSNYYCGLYVSQGTYTIEQAISFGYNCDCVVLGCTDQNALNFNSEATIDDCSCTYDNECPSISFTTSDTSIGWQITDLDGEIVLEHNYNNTNGGNFCSNNCFADGCYLINMTAFYGGGWYQTSLEIGNETFTLSNGYEGLSTFSYNYDMECEVGCTNPDASNYNENAILDDGSCAIFGCTIITACNFDENATAFDGSCYYCFNDDCDTYPIEFYDCEGNCYDLDEDGICDGNEVIGCTDDSACNFNPEATDSGDCEYPDEFYDCLGNCINDNDGDLVCNEIDNCPLEYNPDQEDLNNDGIGDACDGIGNYEENIFYWEVYPNPSENEIKLKLNNKESDDFTIRVRNISGKIIFEKSIRNNELIINNLNTSGYYILEIQSSKEFAQEIIMIK